jgi:hypothetical protein
MFKELNNHSVTDLERIYDGHATSVDQYVRGNGETLADHPKKEEAGLQKDTGTIAQHRDTLACDGESVCSSCEEPRRGLNGEPSDFSSESHSRLTPTHNTGGKLSMVSEHPVHNMESDMTGMASDSTNPELNPEASTRNEMVPPEILESSLCHSYNYASCTQKSLLNAPLSCRTAPDPLITQWNQKT